MVAGVFIESTIIPAADVTHLAPTAVGPEVTETSIEDLNLILQRNIFDPAGRLSLTYNPEMLPSAVDSTEAVRRRPLNMVLLGTVAGDNTIMIAAESPEAAVEVERAIDRLRRR